MNLKSRILGASAGVVLAVGLAGPAFASAPVVATGETAFDMGTMSSRGGCSTVAVGSLSNLAKTSGLTSVEQDITSSSKGVARNSADAAGGLVGQCIVKASAGFSGTPDANGLVTKNVTKFGTKLTSPASDCSSLEGADADERPLSGKLGISYTDLSKTDAYIRVQGFDTAAADKVWLTGIVTKGEGVGATIGGNVIFNPVFKNKGATGYFGSTPTDDPKTAYDEVGVSPLGWGLGYSTNFLYVAGVAIGCQKDANGDGIVNSNAAYAGSTEATDGAAVGLTVGASWWPVQAPGTIPGISTIGLAGGVLSTLQDADGADNVPGNADDNPFGQFRSVLGTSASGVQFLL